MLGGRWGRLKEFVSSLKLVLCKHSTNEKGFASSLRLMWVVLAGLIGFAVWLQIWTPIYNNMLYPYITNSENNIAYSDIIVTLLAFAPLLIVLVIMLMPLLGPEYVES